MDTLPAYDMNAVPSRKGLTLNISDEDNSLGLDLVMAPHFRLSAKEALEIMLHLKKNSYQLEDCCCSL